MGNKQLNQKEKIKKTSQNKEGVPYYVKPRDLTNPYNKPENIITGFCTSFAGGLPTFSFLDHNILVHSRHYCLYFWDVNRDKNLYILEKVGQCFLHIKNGIFVCQNAISRFNQRPEGTNKLKIFDYFKKKETIKNLPNENQILAMTKYNDNTFLYFDTSGTLYSFCFKNDNPKLIVSFPIIVENKMFVEERGHGIIHLMLNNYVLTHFNMKLYVMNIKTKQLISFIETTPGMHFLNGENCHISTKYHPTFLNNPNMYFFFGENHHLELFRCSNYDLIKKIMQLIDSKFIQSFTIYGKGRYIGVLTYELIVIDIETQKCERHKKWKYNINGYITCTAFFFVLCEEGCYWVFNMNKNKMEKFELKLYNKNRIE